MITRRAVEPKEPKPEIKLVTVGVTDVAIMLKSGQSFQIRLWDDRDTIDDGVSMPGMWIAHIKNANITRTITVDLNDVSVYDVTHGKARIPEEQYVPPSAVKED